MTVLFVDTFFCLVADNANLIAFHQRFNNFRFYVHAFHYRGTNRDFIAVDSHECVECELFCALREEVHPQGLFFADKILLARDLYDCFHFIP